jgi:division/cell wall cluster transcriptional repressor MraZ
MLNTGWGPLKLDQRFRLGLPTEARAGYTTVGQQIEFYIGVIPGVAHPSIWMLSKAQYDALCRRFDRLGDTEDGRLIKSAAIGNFTTAVADSQGRVYLPPRLVEQAGIKDQVMLVGLGDRLEVWASEALESLLKTKKEQIRRGLEALFEKEVAVTRSNALGPAGSGSGEGSPGG